MPYRASVCSSIRLKIAQAWAKAARMAAAGELTQAASMQLLDALMQETTGQRFNTQGMGDFCKVPRPAGKSAGFSRAIATTFALSLEDHGMPPDDRTSPARPNHD